MDIDDKSVSAAHHYKAVGWNRQKRIYDLLVGSGVALYLAAFILVGALLRPNATAETLIIRGLGSCALLLLHLILSIGPLCRLEPRFLPLLYNRRHLGVTMFLVALAHGGFSIFQFHAFGDTSPLLSLLISNGRYGSVAQFPFQPLGLLSLTILFLMAATSHDFWLANLTPRVWKSLHMLVYPAYALIVMHVALGTLQVEPNPLLALLLFLGLAWVLGIHLAAAWKERRVDLSAPAKDRAGTGYLEACRLGEIPEGRACIISLSGQRVAIFRNCDKLSAVSNVCQHQNGPLGEGRIRNGCITCPWHGYEYRPETGSSPPPFTERVATFHLRLRGDRVLLDPRPNPPGTYVEPVTIPSSKT